MAKRITGNLVYAFVLGLLALDNSVIVEADCSSTTIGLENMYVIPNNSFTASSSFNDEYIPSNARLNGYNGWGPGLTQYENAYLQVDLGYPHVICAIATKGSNVRDEWVKEYKIMTSIHGTDWVDYEENDEVKVFEGNTDRNTIVKNKVKNKLLARHIRIYPTSYKNWLTMRVGLYGYPEACDNLPLGMQSNVIQNITASSADHPAKNARLHYTSGSSWCASTSDSDPYLQIDLGSFHLICAVATQGNSQADQWVKTYQIDTSTDGTTWATYQENNTDRVFQGNFDRSTIVRQVLYHGTIARYVRIIPKTHNTARCMRTEIYGYQVNQTCSSHSLGLPSSQLVPNHRFTATSHYNTKHQPFMGRLGSDTTWAPEKQKNVNDYLQIDLGDAAFICSIATQGNGQSNLYEWVTQYQVLYSVSNKDWKTYRENETDKNFPGNTDQSTIVTNPIKNLFKAKFIRILPTDLHRWKSLRVDFKGLSAACVSSLGIENSYLPDSQITSSSSSDSSHTGPHGRLYANSSWCSSTPSGSDFIQVDLGEMKTVTGIATQGDSQLNKWVTSYQLRYSFDDSYWFTYTEGSQQFLSGNSNSPDVIVNWLSHPIAARYVRILPKTSSGGPCLRLDLYGCTYYIPDSPINSVTPDNTSASLRWTNIQTHEGTADSFTITVNDRAGLTQQLTSTTTSKQITNLKPYTDYEVKVIGVTSQGQPLWQSKSKFKTNIAVPAGIPVIAALTPSTSQSINVTIKFTQADKLHGPMAGYRIFYTPEGGEEKYLDVGNVTMATLTNLEKYTEYTISVSVRNTKYIGPKSSPRNQRTHEDVPEIGPRNTHAKKLNATSYLVTWQPLSEEQSNGLITKYEIILQTEIATQSKALYLEYLTGTTTESQFRIHHLRPNEKYTAIVRGYTRVGPGPNSTVSFLTSTGATKLSTSSVCTTEGNTITLGCLTSDEYAGIVRYTWTKDGVKVDGDSSLSVEEHKLIVKSVGEDDFGTYVCNATNSARTIVLTTSKFELNKCSGEEIASTTGENETSKVNIYYIIPLGVVIVFMVICIVILIFRLKRARQNDEARRRMVDDKGNPTLDRYASPETAEPTNEPYETPEGVIQEDVQRTGAYMEIPGAQQAAPPAVYESLDDAARAAKEESKKEYMELKPVGPALTYEPLRHGDRSNDPQRYQNLPGVENVAMDKSDA